MGLGVQINDQVSQIDSRKSSTTSGGGRRTFTMNEQQLKEVVEVKIFNFNEELEMALVIKNKEEVGRSEIGCDLPKDRGVSASTGARFWSRS